MKYIKLFETYQSQKDLEFLTKAILERMAEVALEKLDSNMHRIRKFHPVSLHQFNPRAFGSLEKFIVSFGDMFIQILPPAEFEEIIQGAKAAYVKTKEQKFIILVQDSGTLERANDHVANWNYDNTEQIKTYISSMLHSRYSSSLIHELQHAYDDWRSKGKYAANNTDYIKNQQQYVEITNKFEKIPNEVKEQERELLNKLSKQYLNLRYEVDARFASAIQKLSFYDLDLELSYDENKNVYLLRPFEEVIRDFKGKMYPFQGLEPEQQQRVLRKLGQFYEMEKDFVKKLNDEQQYFDRTTFESVSINENFLNDNFKRWFDGSKVINENGEPLVCYHGTKSNFNKFRPSKSIGNQGESDQVEGMYFTDNIEGASWYALDENDSRFLKAVYLSIKNPYIIDNYKNLKAELEVEKLSEVNAKLRDMGYDGIIMENGFYSNGGPYKLFLTLEPNQIKSINNDGTWDIDDDDINS